MNSGRGLGKQIRMCVSVELRMIVSDGAKQGNIVRLACEYGVLGVKRDLIVLVVYIQG